jgi:proteasome accessory factor B
MKGPSKTPRSGETRRPIERIFRIHEQVQRGRFPNCRKLAEKINVTQKTMQRDINFMRDDLGLPIEYDPVRHGYYYTQPVGEFPLLEMSVEDAVALFLARQALTPLENSPLEATLRESFRRLARSLAGKVCFNWSDIDQAFSVREMGVAKAEIAVFEKLSRAVLESKVVSFDYRKLSATQNERRSMHPYSLVDVSGGWYLIGHDLKRDAMRTFALQRIKGLLVSKTKGFVRPDDFRAEDYLGESFGVWRAADAKGKPHRIRIRLEGWAARVASERRWHPSQQVRELRGKGERSEVSFELANLEEITSWVLSWGAQAEVLAPKALRTRVSGEIRKAAKLYRK